MLGGEASLKQPHLQSQVALLCCESKGFTFLETLLPTSVTLRGMCANTYEAVLLVCEGQGQQHLDVD